MPDTSSRRCFGRLDPAVEIASKVCRTGETSCRQRQMVSVCNLTMGGITYVPSNDLGCDFERGRELFLNLSK